MRTHRPAPAVAAARLRVVAFAALFLIRSGAASASDAESGAEADTADEPALVEPLEIVFLANAGFLVRAGGKAVLIDAFVAEPYAGYGSVPESVVVAMSAGAAPFDGVVLALASHVHRDHHQPEAARAYLAARPEVALMTLPEVAALTFPDETERSALRERDEIVQPGPGESVVREAGGVRVEFLGMPHGGSHDIPNLGHVIHIAGRRVLHVGDAAQDREIFAALDLSARDLDVALVPFWYLRTRGGRDFLDEHVAADWYVACHVPPPDVVVVNARLAIRMQNARVPGRALETLRY